MSNTKQKKKKRSNLELSRRRAAAIDKSDNYLTPEPAAYNLKMFSAQKLHAFAIAKT